MGASVEAVDQFGIWSNAKIVSKSENTVVGEQNGIGKSATFQK